MTTRIVIEPASHPVLVQINDHYTDPKGLFKSSHEEQIHLPGDPTIVLYSSTTHSIHVQDLDESDARVVATRKAVSKLQRQ